MKITASAVVLVLGASLCSVAQTRPGQSAAPQPKTQQQAPASNAANQTPDKASAYYHFTLARLYEEMVAVYGRAEFANRAVEEYEQAIEADPDSEYLSASLAELYAKTGRIRDAVTEAEQIIKRDPKNLDAHKLLGRIYLRSLGDLQAGAQSRDLLKRAIEQYETISELDPNNPENLLLLGRLYRIDNDLTKAEQAFKKAVALEPDSEEAAITLAYLYVETGDPNRAAQLLLAVPEANRTSKTYAALGYTYEQKRDFKSAVDAYRKAVDQDDDNLEAKRGLAQNLMNDNQTDAALKEYQAIVEADPHDAQSYTRIAEIYRKQGKLNEALTALKSAQSEMPDSMEIPYSIAMVYEAQGKFDDAAGVLQDLLNKSEKGGDNPAGDRGNRAVFLERLGSLYRDMGKTQQSVDTFRQMLTLGDEAASRGYQQIIDTYRENRQYSEATETAQEATKKLPKDRSLKLILASQLADSGQADKGIQLARSLLNNSPDDRDVYVGLAQVYSHLKRWSDAESAINKAESLSSKPEEKVYTAFIAGSIYERQQKYEQAEKSFRQVLEQDPDNAAVLNYLGYMLADRGVRLDEALGYIKKAVQLDPQNGAYLDSLGWAYFKLGDFVLAEDNLVKAAERTNDDPTILDHLGDLYMKTDRLKMAASSWERALHEFGRTVSSEVDEKEVTKVQQKLESARLRLAKEQGADNSR